MKLRGTSGRSIDMEELMYLIQEDHSLVQKLKLI